MELDIKNQSSSKLRKQCQDAAQGFTIFIMHRKGMQAAVTQLIGVDHPRGRDVRPLLTGTPVAFRVYSAWPYSHENHGLVCPRVLLRRWVSRMHEQRAGVLEPFSHGFSRGFFLGFSLGFSP